VDKSKERKDIQSINIKQTFIYSVVDIPTHEWKYNILFKKTLHFLFWSHVLLFINYDFYNYIGMNSNQHFFSCILHEYKF